MQSISPSAPLQPATADDVIHWLRNDGWTISCTGGGDEWVITGYKSGNKISGAGNSMMDALMAAWEQAQISTTVP